MREGKNGKRSNPGDPQSSHDERVPASIFITMHARARASSPLALVFLIPGRFTFFGGLDF